MLGDNIQIRYRHSYFPFTEPSIEVDIQTSSNSNWLEVIGCGMLHRKVLDHMPIHTRQDYKGLAFGMGIDRLVMLYYNLNDLKTLFQNDLRFLNQFIGY
jgi:phenylalanyl-tRNA synthetase alpha chain